MARAHYPNRNVPLASQWDKPECRPDIVHALGKAGHTPTVQEVIVMNYRTREGARPGLSGHVKMESTNAVADEASGFNIEQGRILSCGL